VSIWGLDMTFKLNRRVLAAGLVFTGAVSAFAGAEEFLSAAFGAVPEAQTLVLSAQMQAAAGSIMGGRYSRSSVSFWREEGKTAWILEAHGKTDLIEAGFVIEQGRIIKSEVLEFRESRGGQIRSERFLKQFAGLSLRTDRQLSRRVDGYSGATLSVNAMRNMARLALYLDSVVNEDVNKKKGDR